MTESFSSTATEHLDNTAMLQLKNSPLGHFSSGASTAFSQGDTADLINVAAKVRQNPIMLRRLSERVLEIMRLDLQHQKERSGHY